MTERSREEASKLERQIAEDHSHQGANELLEQLQRVGQFLRDAEGKFTTTVRPPAHSMR